MKNGLMEALGVSSNGVSEGSEPMKKSEGDGSNKGLASRLRKALEAGNDDRVYSVLKGVVQDCMSEPDEDDDSEME